jgi:hypothetical protein
MGPVVVRTPPYPFDSSLPLRNLLHHLLILLEFALFVVSYYYY